MTYKVIKDFTDLQDGNTPYKVGDTYPRKGLKVTEERTTELAGNNNRQKQPLIKAMAEKKTAKKEE